MKLTSTFSNFIHCALWWPYYYVVRQSKIWLCSEMRPFWLGNTQLLCFSRTRCETAIFIYLKIEQTYNQKDFVIFCHVFDLLSKKFLKIWKLWFLFVMEFFWDLKRKKISISSLFVSTTWLKIILKQRKWSILMPSVSVWLYL